MREGLVKEVPSLSSLFRSNQCTFTFIQKEWERFSYRILLGGAKNEKKKKREKAEQCKRREGKGREELQKKKGGNYKSFDTRQKSIAKFHNSFVCSFCSVVRMNI